MPDKMEQLIQLARSGEVIAQCELAELYLSGTEVDLDAAKGVYWLREAAYQGFPFAQFNLGLILFEGYCPPQNVPESAEWFRRAAEAGHEGAAEFYERVMELLRDPNNWEPDDSDDPEANQLVEDGDGFLTLGMYEKAIELYDLALERDPNYYDPWQHKAVALNRLGRYEEALICIDKALEISPSVMASSMREDLIARIRRKRSL